jgi:hypothetical protein
MDCKLYIRNYAAAARPNEPPASTCPTHPSRQASLSTSACTPQLTSSPVTCPLCPWATEYPHATCSHPASIACIARIARIAFFPISHLPGSSRPLSHYPPASMLQADNVNNRRRQRQRQRPSVQHPLSPCLPLRPSCLYTTTAELDTPKPALFIPLCMTSTQSHP